MLSELKRQETILNAAEREQRGLEQLQRADAKAADNVQHRLDAQVNTDKRALEDREKAQIDKQRTHKQQAQPAKSLAPMAKSGALPDAKTAEKNRETYLEKQRALEKRRQEREQRLLDQSNDVRPLPLPP